MRFFTIFCLILCSFASSYSPTALSSELTQKNVTSSDRVIRIGIPEQPQIGVKNNQTLNELTRFLQEFWQIWAIDYSYNIQFVAIDPRQATSALLSGQIDINATSMLLQKVPNVLYSIPFAKVRQRLFRRIDSDQIEGIQIGIHSPLNKPLFINDGQVTQEIFATLDQLVAEQSKFDALYSITPWALTAKLTAADLLDQFYANPTDISSIYLHSATRESDRSLMYDINEGLRNISKLQAELWAQKYDFNGNSNITLAVGNYLKIIPETEKQYLIDHNYISYVLPSAGLPPFLIAKSFSNINDSGFVIDVMQKATEKFGLLFAPHYVDSNEQYFSVAERGSVDLIPIATGVEKDVTGLSFSVPYLKTRFSLITRTDTNIAHNLNALANESIGVIGNSANTKILMQRLPNASFTEYDNHQQLLKALSHGEINAFIGSTLISSYYIKKLLLTNLTSQPLANYRNDSYYRFAVKRADEPLLALLNRTINSMSVEELNAIYNKWSQSVFKEKDIDEYVAGAYRQAGYVLVSIVLLGFLLAFVYFRQLNLIKSAQKRVEDALTIAEAARADAEKSAQAKITFLARMSHEIRTPMNGVLGMAEELSFTELNSTQKDLLNILNSSARNLLDLLNDVLDFSKIDAGKLTLEHIPVDIESLCAKVVASFKHHENEKPITLEFFGDKNLAKRYYSAPIRLTQVLNNLLSNAVKFTPNGEVRLSINHLATHIQTNNDIYHQIKIEVTDTGIGITKEQQSALFTPFVQADHEVSRRFGGTGLGLSISQEIINAMGGNIYIASEKDKGSTFYFSLRLKVAAGEIDVPERRHPDRNTVLTHDDRFKQLRILLAEDNIVNVKVLTAQLARLNIFPDIAQDGKQALAMHQESPYDIIISDCHMPNMDGFELAQHISQQQQAVWLIAVTADALSGSAEKCIAAGFNDYMSKPSTQQEITDKLYQAYRSLKELGRVQ
ncbi:ATP-binding protein [Colwellia sp. MEBiC06753]